MARRRASREAASSLFPFLSVLACVIGTLTLLIAALALGQLAQDLLAEESRPLREEELRADEAALADANALLDEARRVREERTAVEAELRRLGVRPDAGEDERRRSVETRLAAARVARKLASLERRAEELDAAVVSTRTAIVSEEPGDDSGPIRILPSGSARPLLPFFVECREEGVRVYTKSMRESYYLSRGALEDAAEFRRYLDRIRSVRRATIVFLIRPNGVETYQWASELAGRAYVRHAKLPLPGDGELEFTL